MKFGLHRDGNAHRESSLVSVQQLDLCSHAYRQHKEGPANPEHAFLGSLRFPLKVLLVYNSYNLALVQRLSVQRGPGCEFTRGEGVMRTCREARMALLCHEARLNAHLYLTAMTSQSGSLEEVERA